MVSARDEGNNRVSRPGPAKSTERVRRWRRLHPDRNREQGREAQSRYRGTAKGMLTDLRYAAKRRGT